MHRLSAPSAPLVVFLAAMVGGSSVLHLGIIVLGVYLLCVLAFGVHFIPWRSFALAGVSLSFIVLGFEMTVAQQSQNVAKDVAKCSTECFIELQVSWWQYNKADCKAVEFSQYRQGCTTAIRLPPSQVWLPGTRYRIHGRLFIPSDSTKQVARLKAHARAELGLRPEWGVFLVDKREALRTFVRDRLSPDAQGIVWALISGRRELIASSERDRWSRAGLIHYVAISGLHVGIVLGVWLRGCQGLLGMLSLFGRKQRVLMFTLNIGSVLLLMGLLVWWGTPSSALRSAGMWAVALVARTFRFRYRGSDALGTSGLLLILADPLLSRDLGFQLSSFAVVGLLWAGANDRSTFLAKASSLRT
ncbi:MAG: ComEC/Rec2 family competence protein, partial [Myxococcota bacterium]|nr:ComEC/Rec2 family competence protein [Myxococcota bacterium]